MNEIIIAIAAVIIIIVLYKWLVGSSAESIESGPLSSTPSSSSPSSSSPSSSSSDFGGTTGKQVYLMSGDAVTTDASGTHSSPDLEGGMTVSDLDDTRRKILNPMERSRKSPRALSDRLMIDEMRRNDGGKKMAVGDEELDCIQSVLSPDDIIPGYIPGRRNLVSLAMSE
jgi:hypothetical protein